LGIYWSFFVLLFWEYVVIVRRASPEPLKKYDVVSSLNKHHWEIKGKCKMDKYFFENTDLFKDCFGQRFTFVISFRYFADILEKN